MSLCSKAICAESTGHISGASNLDIEVRVGRVGRLVLHECVLEFEDHGLDVRVRVIHTFVIEVAITRQIVHEGANRIALL